MNLTRLRSLMSRCIWLADMLRSMFAMFFSTVHTIIIIEREKKKLNGLMKKDHVKRLTSYCSQHGITVYFYTFKLILYNQGFPASSEAEKRKTFQIVMQKSARTIFLFHFLCS